MIQNQQARPRKQASSEQATKQAIDERPTTKHHEQASNIHKRSNKQASKQASNQPTTNQRPTNQTTQATTQPTNRPTPRKQASKLLFSPLSFSLFFCLLPSLLLSSLLFSSLLFSSLLFSPLLFPFGRGWPVFDRTGARDLGRRAPLTVSSPHWSMPPGRGPPAS